MAFNSVTFRSELDPVVKKELNHDFFVLEEWQSKEHKDDGTHSAITADSVVITGDLTVGGTSGFEDVILNNLTANEITTELLTVNTTLVLPGAGPNFISSAQVSLLDQTIFNFGGVLSISSSTVFVSGPVELNAESTDTSGNAPLRLKNRDDTVNNWIEMSFYGGDNTGPDPLPVEVGRYGMQVMSHGAIPLADFVWKNETAEIMRLNNGGDLLINTNKFTVDGATGDTAIAGGVTITRANAGDAMIITSSTGTNSAYSDWTNTGGRFFVGRDNSAGNAIGTAGRAYAASIWQESNHDMQFGTNNTERMSISAAGSVAIDGATFNVDAANNRVGIGTASPAVVFHVVGQARLASLTNAVLSTDGNGDIIDFGGIDHSVTVLTDLIGGSETLNFTAGILTSVT